MPGRHRGRVRARRAGDRRGGGAPPRARALGGPARRYALADGRWLLRLLGDDPRRARARRAARRRPRGAPPRRRIVTTRPRSSRSTRRPGSHRAARRRARAARRPPAATTVTPAPAPSRPTSASWPRSTARGRDRAAARGRASEAAARAGRAAVLRTPAARRDRPPPRALPRAAHAPSRPGTTRTRCATRSASAAPAGGWLTLRLPERRSGPLRPTPERGGGGVAPWDSGADLLRELYRRAAEQLEQAGEIERAAFVHADLLRHRATPSRCSSATACSSSPRSSPRAASWTRLVVRLWWRAGARGGRSRSPARAARGRRRSSASTSRARARAAGRLGRVRARPRRPPLRDRRRLAGAGLRAGIGPTWPPCARSAARRRPRSRSSSPGGPTRRRGRGGGARARRRSRRAARVPRRPGRAPARRPDRRPAARRAGVRTLLRDAADRRLRGGRPSFNRLRERADPLLRADLPPFPGQRAGRRAHPRPPPRPRRDRGPRRRLAADGPARRGGRARLFRLTRDGRVAQRWDVAASGWSSPTTAARC